MATTAGARGYARLERKKPSFEFQSGRCAEAAQPAVGADHAVTGHDEGDRVSAERSADGACRTGTADSGSEFAIRFALAPGDVSAGDQHGAREGGQAGEINRDVGEILRIALE